VTFSFLSGDKPINEYENSNAKDACINEFIVLGQPIG
jgi:hypothetical protein